LDQQQFRLVGLACKYHRELRERIGLLPEAKMSVHPSYSKLIQEYVICEECGKLISRYVLNIHHKIPVSLLTYENWQLAFDPQNLIGLCHECHKTKHGEVHKLRGLKLSKDYHKMQAYLYAKNNKKSSKSLKITDFIGVKKP
jgi:5-methylcytosine-specific restriction endonuclease McrA